MKNQTAVELLLDFMSKNEYFIGNDLLQVIEQAKEIEKNQIIKAFTRGYLVGEDESFPIEAAHKAGQKYYDEIIKQNH
jgi:hypothetical protein